MEAEFANIDVTVDTPVLRYQPITFAHLADAKVRPGSNLVLYTVDVEVWREILYTASRNTNVCSTLGTPAAEMF